jgi:hypothetical protein
MQQQLTLNFGLTKIFFLIYRTLSMRQKTKNNQNQGSNAKKNFLFVLFPSPLARWVRLVKKTRSKNSHAWAPLKVPKHENFLLSFFALCEPIWVGDLGTDPKNNFFFPLTPDFDGFWFFAAY